jgi:hypothetical protein
MAVTEIPQGSHAYRVQPMDKDQASQQDAYNRKEKKNQKKAKKQESLSIKSGNTHRINLVI